MVPVLALGSIATHTYLLYVYARTGSIFVTALAHITLNNAQAALGYLFVVDDVLLANVLLTLVMALVVAVLAGTGRLAIVAHAFALPSSGSDQARPVKAR